MDFNPKKDSVNKRESAGFLSRLLFLWMVPLFWKGRKKEIDIDDLDNVPDANRSETLSQQLQEAWEKECSTKCGTKDCKVPNLFKTFLRTFGTRYFCYVGLFAVDGWIVRIAQPVFLKYFIKSFSDDTTSLEWQCLYAAGVCLSTLFHIVLNHPTGFQMCVSGMRCRIAVSSLIYRKALRLSKVSEGQSSVGQIVNLLSNDVTRFDYNLHFVAFLFVGPVQLLIFFYILWQELGIACLAGVGYILLLSPSQFIIGKLSAKFRVQIAKHSDERSRVLNEVIVAMRLIKMYAWEKPFNALICKIRQLEIKALKKRSYLRAGYMGLFTSNFTLVPFLAIITYGFLGNPVTPDKAFFAVAIFNVMTEVMMYYVPNAAASIGELQSSIQRIQNFLLMDEQSSSERLTLSSANNSGPSVKMTNVTCKWNTSKLAIQDVSMDISGNKLIMIIGPVGSGKTSLLQCLLAELPITSGRCSINGTISYAAQEAWIFPGTVRQNILLGRKYDKDRYNRVVSCCALLEDFKQFANGEFQIVGERGVSLSGGQKARVNLARALYHQADIYMLDDPLSAVDVSVSKHIFNNCIRNYLKWNLRILVTHQLQYLPYADHIIVVNDGKVLAQGDYKSLMQKGVDFMQLLSHEEPDHDKDANSSAPESLEYIPLGTFQDGKKDVDEEQTQVANRESMAEGAVTGKTYWDYIRAGDSICQISVLVIAFILNQILVSGTDYWLSLWATKEASGVILMRNVEINPSDLHNLNLNLTSYKYEYDSESESIWDYYKWDRSIFMYIYVGLACSVFVIGISRTLYYFGYSMKISTNIHNKMFSSLVNAPMKFFDANSSGRIMNRFTKDLGTLDEFLPLSMFDALDIGQRTVGCLTIVLILNYYLAIPAVFLLLAYSTIRWIFIKTSRNVKRVETCTRSPLYTHMASSVQGLATIRCLKAQKILISQFDSHQDAHSAAWYHFLAGNNWFSIWLEMCSTAFIAVVVYSFVLFSGRSNTVMSQVGLAVASLLQLMNIFQFGMRQSAEMENFMTSAERALEYTKLEPERSRRSDKGIDNKVLEQWPKRGAIKFKDVSLSYDGQTNILKNLNLEIAAGERIGVVGRTGAGKTSIIAALFRLTEPEGELTIDGCDISAIPLHKLRNAISIIPQDPVLFSGTIRKNLDPFEKFSDEELWRVLEEVELKHLITSLDYNVSEGGGNFSTGERQLVCLSRAILRRNKILFMDEATASCDHGTDNLIQQTIRAKFLDCTIITIAHRLETVLDCDKILVLDNGYVKEFDKPQVLLQNPDGHFMRLRHDMSTSNLNKKNQSEP